jgi:hypothetical protein
MRHTTASILAILAIACCVFFSTGGFDEQIAIEPTLTGRVVTDTPEIIETVVLPETEATLVFAGGLIPSGSILALDETIVFATGSAEILSIEVQGAADEEILFRVQRAPVPESFSPKGGSVLSSHQGENGAYSTLTVAELRSLRGATGSGWYVFTAERPSGTVLSAPVFVR